MTRWIFVVAALSGCADSQHPLVDDTPDGEDTGTTGPRPPVDIGTATFRSDFSRSGVWLDPPAGGGTGAVAWTFAADASDDAPLLTPPLYVDHKVYLATSAGTITALDAATGELLWEQQVGNGGRADAAGMTVAGGYLYAVRFDTLEALNASTGEVLWDATVDNCYGNFATPLVMDGHVFTGSCELDSFDALTGEQDWAYEGNLNATIAPAILGSPAVVGASLVVALLDLPEDGECAYPSLVSVDRTSGMENWRTEFGCDDGPNPMTTPVISGGLVITQMYRDNAVVALDAETGQTDWTTPLDGYIDAALTIAVADGVVYAPNGKDLVEALDGASGEHLWEAPISEPDLVTVAGDFLYVRGSTPTDQQAVYALTRSDGSTLWSYEVGQLLIGEPVVAEGTVVVADWLGTVTALR